MWSIAKKEFISFYGSISGYIVSGLFLLMLGLFLFFFPDTSILQGSYAQLDSLFFLSPFIFMFLLPAITMRLFAEEKQTGTLELLITKPLHTWQIVLGKYISVLLILVITLLPTLLYMFSIYQLGSPKGNLDIGGIIGSYIGLFLLASLFGSIGIFCSSLTNKQVIAFIISIFFCFCCYMLFLYISKISIFVGTIDYWIQQFGIDYHYNRISKGIIDSRDILYFISVIFFFLTLTVNRVSNNK